MKKLFTIQFRNNRKYSILGTLFFCALLFSGCKKDITSTADNQLKTGNNKISSLPDRPDVIVHSGSSIQAAVNAAHPFSVILIQPGTYNEAIVVSKKGIVLIGAPGGVIIQNPGDEENGITVKDNSDGFVLRNVTVKNFKENGVYLSHVNGFLISQVSAVDNGEYGIFPVFCHNGIVDHCTASGHSDTGIYIGQSSDILISDNVAYANVNGLESENSNNIVITRNTSYNNVLGILVVLLPGLEVKTSHDIVVSKNYIHDNNHINFSSPGGGFENYIPSGVGVLNLGSDRTIIKENLIKNNNFLGLATVSTLVLGALAGLPSSAFADIEPNPDGNKIIQNTLVNNGTVAPAGIPFPAVDLLWDGSGLNNCWSNNIFTSSYPSPLPGCGTE